MRLLEIKKVNKPAEYNFYGNFKIPELENKVQELIVILEQSRLNKNQIKLYEKRISHAFQKSLVTSDLVKPFKILNKEDNLSREDLLEGLEKLLAHSQIDSKVSRKYLRNQTLQKVLLCLIAVVLVLTGFAMIIMPAPPSFELFTVFYFNYDDGITIMDLVSLLLILSGVFLFVLNVNKK